MKKKQSLESRQVKSGYLFTLPFLIGSSFFVIFPIIISIVFSLSHVSNDSSGYTVDFLGLDNYKYMLMSDPNYNQTVLNTLKTMLINIPVVAIFSFFIASLLNQEFKGKGIIRTVVYLPVMIAPLIMGYIMYFFFTYNNGAINDLLAVCR